MVVNQQQYRTIWHESNLNDAGVVSKVVRVIDQTQLPHAFEVLFISNLSQMVEAIKTMQVRGAPLIGAAAAYGIALATQEDASDASLERAAGHLLRSRPTAVNLRWAVERMLGVLSLQTVEVRSELAWIEATLICDEDVSLNQAIGAHGLGILRQLHASQSRTINVLTHCNAGWLATVDFGTALAPIYAAHDAGLSVHVWVSETRPRNQGASLTAWELGQHGVAHTVITDNAGGHLIQQGLVDIVIVGADRVTITGDVCNKIGTYLKALAAYQGDCAGRRVPFYVAAPTPTIDWTIEDGIRDIEIEERAAEELIGMVGRLKDGRVATVNILPEGTQVLNPAFDVTPAKWITGIITEHGVFAPHQLHGLRGRT
ncbi:MAG: S-methyl-5-thioribose-1-phosphate isomerase [Betaproteobacteria bacterium]|nr:S-methyl-5-thioribose-1-phosphate isomerase [Betaproteobacteria bacterium]